MTPTRADTNKRRVEEFLTTTFRDRDLAKTPVYFREDYIEHNPMNVAPGRDGFIEGITGLLEAFPDAALDVHHLVAEGDLVVAHLHWKTNSEAPDFAVVDIYRLDENGLIAEHWDVLMEVPVNVPNPNGLF